MADLEVLQERIENGFKSTQGQIAAVEVSLKGEISELRDKVHIQNGRVTSLSEWRHTQELKQARQEGFRAGVIWLLGGAVTVSSIAGSLLGRLVFGQ